MAPRLVFRARGFSPHDLLVTWSSCFCLSKGGALQAMQKISRALRMWRGSEERRLVILQYLDPRRDIGGVVRLNPRRQVEVGAKEGWAKLGDLSWQLSSKRMSANWRSREDNNGVAFWSQSDPLAVMCAVFGKMKQRAGWRRRGVYWLSGSTLGRAGCLLSGPWACLGLIAWGLASLLQSNL